jgi:hypothetical protein
MTQADSVHSTPPTNTSATRRRFLSQSAGMAAGGAVLALATIPLASASAAPASPLDPANASPALRAAARALDDAHERLKAAEARFVAADAKVYDWANDNPEPEKGRARKRWVRKWNAYRDETSRPIWEAQLDAERDFVAAQTAVAKIDSRDMGELALKACISAIYDKVRLGGGQSAIIGYSVSLDLMRLTMRAAS